MRKLALLLVALLIMGGIANADVKSPVYSNVINIDGHGEVDEPAMFVKRVRYGMQGANAPALTSGMVVSWDTVSHDGVTVTATIINNAVAVGVLVTALLTQDVNNLPSSYEDDNYGYMCVEGYCLANIDITQSETGGTLVVANSTAIGTNEGYFATRELEEGAYTSEDCGTLLGPEPAADGLSPVMLRLR